MGDIGEGIGVGPSVIPGALQCRLPKLKVSDRDGLQLVTSPSLLAIEYTLRLLNRCIWETKQWYKTLGYYTDKIS